MFGAQRVCGAVPRSSPALLWPNLSMPQLPHLSNGVDDNNCTFSAIGLLLGLN